MEFHSPRVEKIGEKYYWVAGQSEVHHLNHLKSEEANYYSMKLSKEEIEELPVVIIYTGFDQNSYSNDEEKAFAILLEIIALMNSMQDPLWHSFLLGKNRDRITFLGSKQFVLIVASLYWGYITQTNYFFISWSTSPVSLMYKFTMLWLNLSTCLCCCPG